MICAAALQGLAMRLLTDAGVLVARQVQAPQAALLQPRAHGLRVEQVQPDALRPRQPPTQGAWASLRPAGHVHCTSTAACPDHLIKAWSTPEYPLCCQMRPKRANRDLHRAPCLISLGCPSSLILQLRPSWGTLGTASVRASHCTVSCRHSPADKPAPQVVQGYQLSLSYSDLIRACPQP